MNEDTAEEKERELEATIECSKRQLDEKQAYGAIGSGLLDGRVGELWATLRRKREQVVKQGRWMVRILPRRGFPGGKKRIGEDWTIGGPFVLEA